MSLRSMVAKLALALVAAKGVQVYRQAGGMEGVKRKLAEQKQSGQGIGGMLGGSGAGGGLDGVLASLGMSGAQGAGSSGGIGGLLGGLAGATGGAAGAQKMRGLLDTTRAAPVAEEAEAGLVIRAMVMAAKADGDIDATERRTLWEVLGDSEASDRAFMDQALAAPVDVAALVRDVPKGLEVEIYTASVMAIDPDNRAEAEYLDSLAQGLGIDRATVNAIHDAQGKPPLYTL